jgi:hypothetical protein
MIHRAPVRPDLITGRIGEERDHAEREIIIEGMPEELLAWTAAAGIRFKHIAASVVLQKLVRA